MEARVQHPTKPFSGPAWEKRDGKFWCKVPGCDQALRPKPNPQGIAIHLARGHGLTREGKPWAAPAKDGKPQPQEPKFEDVSVRGLIRGTELAVLTQAINAVRAAKGGLTGKLADMERLRLQDQKLDFILHNMKQLLPSEMDGTV